MSVHQSTDLEIRSALHRKRLQSNHNCPSTLVIDELGLAHGKNRIDIAVLNGCLHGYEIKSSKDNLLRLPNQLEAYKKSLQKLTIVTASNHVDEVIDLAPAWCGIILADKGPRGGIRFTTLRKPLINPDIDVVSLAHLLWKKEVIDYLQKLGADSSLLKGTRIELYENLSCFVSVNELVSWIKEQFAKRESWRADLLLL